MPKGCYLKTPPEELKKKLSLLKSLQHEPLDFKIEYSQKIIRKALEGGNSCILYSGGKDSTVLQHLTHGIMPGTPIIYNSTTLETPGLLQYIRDFTSTLPCEYIETTPELPPVEFWKKTGYFPILPKLGFHKYKKRIPGLRIQPVACCHNMKFIPANREFKKRSITVLFWGNKAGDSHRRALNFCDNGFLFLTKEGKWNCYPLQHWTDADVFTYLNKYLPDYNPGNRAQDSGCVICCTDIKFYPNNSSRLFLSNRDLWTYYMKAGFAEQIIKIKGFLPEKLDEIINNRPELLLKV